MADVPFTNMRTPEYKIWVVPRCLVGQSQIALPSHQVENKMCDERCIALIIAPNL